MRSHLPVRRTLSAPEGAHRAYLSLRRPKNKMRLIPDAVRPVSGTWDDHTIYEDIDEVGGCSGDAARRLEARRELSSDSSWSEEFESMSEPDDEPRPTENFGAIKGLLRRKRPSQNQQKPKQKNGRAASEPVGPAVERKSSLEKRAPMLRRDSEEGEGRLSRWFSLRKSSHYDISERSRSLAKMTSVTEDAEAAELLFHRRHQPPSLPAAPAGLSAEQLKRRHIVQSIVSSENNYVASLQSLVNDYKKAMEEANPPLLNPTKISVIFKRVPEILQCHTLFRIALAEAVKQWDAEERIGDVFVASFSKAIVLDIYSDFINNFSVSMETIKHEAKRKSTFADFLKMRQISSPDRLSLFGLMVKPVQRFPQFILLLQDLLKHTPQGHHDRMSLQLALTQLESLAEMLNERKRESEQFKAFRETLRRLNGKFSMRSLADTNRYLLREDNATRLEFGTNGTITKSKNRRLFLLNDLVVCVSVAGKTAEDAAAPDRLTLKWSVPVTDVEIQETSTSLTLSHVITATAARPPGGARGPDEPPAAGGAANDLSNVGQLCHKMGNLMHDYEVISRIGALVETLKGEYPGLNTALTSQIAASIQRSIRQKDEEIAWLDACCLQLTVRRAGKEEHFTFQLESPAKKREWTTDFRLAQLALDGNNSPAWDIPEREQRAITRVPLFVKTMPVVTPAAAIDDTEVRCGCFYSVTIVKPTQRTRQQSYLWICTSDGVNSFVMIYAMQQVGFRDVLRFELPGERVTAMEYVSGEMTETGCRSGAVWISTASSRLLQYSAQEPEHSHQVASASLPSPARRLVPHGAAVFAALENGAVAAIERASDGGWLPGEPALLRLGTRPVACLLPIGGAVYAGCGRQVSVIDAETREVVKSFTVQEHECSGDVHLLAHSGIGLWISLAHSSTICLYHTETFRHLQDINVASNISRVMGDGVRQSVAVTALLAGRGLLWVGTSVGVTLTIPLPRLEGVPIISGRGNISYHAHCGPVTYLQVLSAPAPRAPPPAAHRESVIMEEAAPDSTGRLLEKRRSDTSLSDSKKSMARLPTRFSSPSLLRKRSRDRDMNRRLSKTLPRGVGLPSAGSVLDDVYGLYGNLLNLPGFDESRELGDIDSQLRRSDPELLAGLPHKMASLDRRLELRGTRPRSLDLSTWSVDSRSSAHTTSSSSEGDRAHSAPASRVASFRTDTTTSDGRSAGSGSGASGDSARPKEEPARSVLTVMAGRGYVNWSRAERKSSATTPRPPTARDAHLVLWEMKL
ncbi:rho guanine nucleotide exchange factor 10-like isoform X5 [Amphibalanus amphitrite]|uniref:rho guanine nucleotide exchange factor 10-like isoform X5 n=1 Tax=Amphibalanus amphitrite TaxID=1232801 RepID=UPI001C909E13|nr:rho guanine nucleotide exchange factor 10-like isoform X5 [Amphibalanus amphitrite]